MEFQQLMKKFPLKKINNDLMLSYKVYREDILL